MGMTGSSHDGEALSALRHANRVMVENRITWRELLTPALPAPEREIPQGDEGHFSGSWRDAVRFAGRQPDFLTVKEYAFIRQLAGYNRTPSEKQLAWLRNIVERLLRQGATQS
jgi:hypothetical protein